MFGRAFRASSKYSKFTAQDGSSVAATFTVLEAWQFGGLKGGASKEEHPFLQKGMSFRELLVDARNEEKVH